jgi:predicted kinase
MPLYKCKCCGPKKAAVKEKTVKTLIMTKGLPGSGKSTWAKEYVLKSAPGSVVRVNKDDLRMMLHADRWRAKTEDDIVRARDALVETFLLRGESVIVDDTNFNPVHERRLRVLAERHGAQFEIEDFTKVPLHTCIARDLKREKSVGAEIIRRLYNDYVRPPVEPVEYVEGLPNAVLVDIDGTLAKMVQRKPFDWHKVGTDAPMDDIIDLVNNLRVAGAEIVFLSGRDGSCYEATREWLAQHVGPWTISAHLHMRAPGDNRKDAVVKREIYEGKIRNYYNTWFVLDDRNQVVEMWRGLGLRCLQVAPGDF